MPETISRRYTWDEAELALRHIRYDLTAEPAKAILYALTDRQQVTICGATYAVSWDAGESMFFLTVSGDSRRILLLHEKAGAGCHCREFR